MMQILFILFFLLPATGKIEFRDVTLSSGIGFVHHGGSPEKRMVVEQMSGGVALFDYNGDGWLDIYFVTGPDSRPGSPTASNRLYRNNRDGTFTDVTDAAGVGFQGWSMGTCVGDYDGDGIPDLYVTNFGPNVLYHNNGDGTFTDVSSKAGVDCPKFSTGAAFGDYDQDGDLDLFVANYVEFDLKNPPMKDDVCHYLGIRVNCGPRGMEGAPDFLYRNNGDGTFTDVSHTAGVSDDRGYYGLGVLWSDIDNDGDQDLFVANDATPNYLYLNDGRGGFEDTSFLGGVAVGGYGKNQSCMGVDIADCDGDGQLDIVVTNFSEDYNTLYRNLGNAMFSDVSYEAGLAFPSLSYLAWGTKFFDADCDGDLDLFIANGHVYPQIDSRQLDVQYAQRNQLFLNSGSGRFDEYKAPKSGLDVVRCSRGAAFGDLDNDGDIDIVSNNLDAAPTILRNDTRRAGRQLTVRLVGKKPNTLAIGARVSVFVRGGQLVQEVRSGGSYLCQNDFRLHYGLGSADQVDRVLIRWPDGREQSLEDIAADQLITVLQEE